MKMQMLAEIIAACFKKGNEGCFTCGDKNHLKRDCPKKVNKNLQKFALSAVEKCIGSKTVNLNLIFFSSLYKFKRRFLLKYYVAIMTPGFT